MFFFSFNYSFLMSLKVLLHSLYLILILNGGFMSKRIGKNRKSIFANKKLPRCRDTGKEIL